MQLNHPFPQPTDVQTGILANRNRPRSISLLAGKAPHHLDAQTLFHPVYIPCIDWPEDMAFIPTKDNVCWLICQYFSG